MAIKVKKEEIPATVIEAKRWWRREVSRVLGGTTDEYRREASAAIVSRVRELPEFGDARTVMMYFPVGREVNVRPLMDQILADSDASGRRICLPLCTNENGRRTMEARLVTELDALAEGSYGIPEPGPDDPLIAPEEIDMIVLPCVSCDAECRRLGHGAGYYDRYLGSVRNDCYLAAVCYDAVLADEIPTEEHDRRVDAVITEAAVHRWRRL